MFVEVKGHWLHIFNQFSHSAHCDGPPAKDLGSVLRSFTARLGYEPDDPGQHHDYLMYRSKHNKLFQETNRSCQSARHFIVRHLQSFEFEVNTDDCQNTILLTLFIWCVIDSTQFWQASTRAIIFANLARITACDVRGFPNTIR